MIGTRQPAEARAPRARRLELWLERRARFVLPAPAIIVLALIVVFPIIYTLYTSLTEWEFSTLNPPVFVGLRNYVELLSADPHFKATVWRTIRFTAYAVSIQTVLGVGLALMFNRQFWGQGFFRSLAVMPMVATPVAISLIFVMMYHPTLGVMNYLLQVAHLPKYLWIFDQKSVIASLVLVDSWQWVPLIMLMSLAGLAAMPKDPYEAAMIDGANQLQMFWHVMLPLLRPTIMVAVLFRLIDSLKTFDIIFVMTQGGPGDASMTLNYQVFNTAFDHFRMGYASAMVVLFFTIILAISLVFMRLRRAADL